MEKNMKKNKYLKSFLNILAVLICMFTVGISVQAATVPKLTNGKYIRTYPLSTRNNTYIYTSSSLRTRGTSSPYKAYNAVIYASDEIYVYNMQSRYSYVSYPTSSGRRYGYIPTSAITGINSSESPYTSRASIVTYKRAGSGKYGNISKGDRVFAVGVSGGYTQVIYPVGSNYKMGWISTSNYNNYVKTVSVKESYVNNGMYIFRSALSTKMVMDVNGAGTGNGTNIHLWESNGGNNQKYQVTRQSSGWYRIADVNSGKVIDVTGGQKGNSVNVQLYQWNGSDAQLWKFYNAGNNYYYIKNKLGYYLDVQGGNSANGTNILVYELNQGTNQKWQLVSTSKNSSSAQNYLISQSEINSAANTYRISTSSNAYKALNLINSKYYSQLKSNANGINVFLFEGVGASSSASKRMNAMCVVVKNKKIVYINKYCSTIPDNPFKPSLNDGTAVPTLLSGVHNFSTTNHQASKSVSKRYIPYAALHINGNGTNVLRHNSVNSYYYSNSSAINVHGRSGSRTNSSRNSVGCLLVGDVFASYPREYAGFIKAVGVVSSSCNVTKATKCAYWPTGKLVVDRSYARSYLQSVGYSVGAINILVK